MAAYSKRSRWAAYAEVLRIDDVFRALADPNRRRLLDSLRARDGQTLHELCTGLEMARQSVSKHLAVLEAANLVTTVRRGREKLHYLNAAPINDIAERWISRYDQPRVMALSELKHALEETNMDKPDVIYAIYIRATPERVWRALTEPAFTQRYWQTTLVSDWKPGSHVTWHHRGLVIDGPGQVVLESDPFRRLSYTWHDFTREWADTIGFDDATFAKIAGEPRSHVTFDIEDLGEVVKLTVMHAGFGEGSTAVELVRQGWPRVISDLKTLLETGETLPVE